MMPVAADQQGAIVGGRYESAELTFMALPPGDPRIKASTIEKPDYTQRVQMR